MTFYEASELIRYQYQQGHGSLGYRFLYTPATSWDDNNGILVLGINPGGNKPRFEMSFEEGNAYLHEEWKSPLQKKFVKFMFEIAARTSRDPIALMEECIASNLVPWIAPNVDSLLNYSAAVEFGTSLWESYLEMKRTRVVISIGSLAYNQLTSDYLDTEVIAHNRQKVHFVNKNGILFIRIPHLSHWAAHCDHPSLLNPIAERLQKALVYRT